MCSTTRIVPSVARVASTATRGSENSFFGKRKTAARIPPVSRTAKTIEPTMRNVRRTRLGYSSGIGELETSTNASRSCART